jgi:zinc protease
MKIVVFFAFILSGLAYSSNDIASSIKKYNYEGLELIFIPDNRFPTYDLVIYFADGALSDGKNNGSTEHSFNLIDAGTKNMSQKEIFEKIEFLGTDLDVDVTHEYSTVSISGLSKDYSQAVTDVCRLLKDATYPSNVLKQELDQEKMGLKALVGNPQALADRAYREVSMKNTPYSNPGGGKLKDLDKLNSKMLREKMDYFLSKVQKKLYLTGPSSLLSETEKIIEECQLKGKEKNFIRTVNSNQIVKNATNLVFVPLPDLNQVQLRIGRFLNSSELTDRNLDILASDLLGGGFTSKLMREVRVKRGLTYSIGSFISSQKEYGRAGISTFTKNSTIKSLVDVIDQTVTGIVSNGITKDELDLSIAGLVGSHPFKFENNKAFLLQLLYLDHIGKNYSDLFEFNELVSNYKESDVQSKIKDVFGMDKQTIFILGDKSLMKDIKSLSKKYGKVKVLDYNIFI